MNSRSYFGYHQLISRRKRDRKGSAKTGDTGENKALEIMDSIIEAQQTQIAYLKTEVLRTSTLLEASREAQTALASTVLKLEDKLFREDRYPSKYIIQENSARDEAQFTTFAKMLEDVRVSSASVGKPAR